MYSTNRDTERSGFLPRTALGGKIANDSRGDAFRLRLRLEDADQETVAQLLAKHRLLAVPVLDQEGHMLGIITSADVAGLVQQEAGEDILKIGGMEALDGPYLEVTFGQMVRKRAGWLAILFVGEMLTATAMGFFSAEIERAVVLALIHSSNHK